MDGLVERVGAATIALPMWAWVWAALAAVVIALVLWLVLCTPRRVKIANQQRYVAAWEDACQAHPGMYEAELERERAKLDSISGPRL